MRDHNDDDEQFDDEQPPEAHSKVKRDPGGVPAALVPRGYRSIHPAVGVSAAVLFIAVIATVLWSLMASSRTTVALGAQKTIIVKPTQDSNTNQVIPDPTDPPITGVPRTKPVIQLASAHATAAPQYSNASSASMGPAGQTPAQLAAEDDARKIAEASAASSRMQLDSQSGSSTAAAGTNDQQMQSNASNTAPQNAMAFSGDNSAPHQAFINGNNDKPGYEAATSRYELVTGTIIPARLITAIDSTVPGGLIKAEIIEAVFDSRSHSSVVLPQGTIAIGYSDQALYGEARLVAKWTEFYLPNGRKFYAGSNEGAGDKGEAGMPVSVDTHAGRTFGNSLVGAILQAGVNLASRASSINISTSQNSTQNNRANPTLHAYPGQRFNIVLNHDLPLDRYEH